MRIAVAVVWRLCEVEGYVGVRQAEQLRGERVCVCLRERGGSDGKEGRIPTSKNTSLDSNPGREKKRWKRGKLDLCTNTVQLTRMAVVVMVDE